MDPALFEIPGGLFGEHWERMAAKIRAGMQKGSDEDCWEWKGMRKNPHYGGVLLSWSGRPYAVHRVVYSLIHGTIPEKMCVCHRCNHKLCVNPQHLYLATKGDNMRDAWRDGLCKLPTRKPS